MIPTDNQYNSKETPLLWLIAQMGSIWVISGIGYNFLLPVVGLGGGYNANPVQITLYYLFWIVLTVYSFWNIYSEWKFFEGRVQTYITIFVSSILITSYLAFVLPTLPSINLFNSYIPPSDLLSATPWYFLPKSFDIFLQQLLVIALVLSFHLKGYSLRSVSVWCAVLFGGAHLLLVLGGKNVFYVTLFTTCATMASFVFPYLILRVKNGFIYSYLLHWSFYAVLIYASRVLLS
jgi:hypothetical protein